MAYEHQAFPKHLYKGWKLKNADLGQYEAAESKLVHSEEEAKALLKDGFSEAAPKHEPPKKAEKAKE